MNSPQMVTARSESVLLDQLLKLLDRKEHLLESLGTTLEPFKTMMGSLSDLAAPSPMSILEAGVVFRRRHRMKARRANMEKLVRFYEKFFLSTVEGASPGGGSLLE